MLPSGTVTFLFTDIEGSTSRWESDPARMQASLQEHNQLLDRVFAEYRGSIFKTVGDAYCAAFNSAEDAAQAAIAAQDNLARMKDPLSVRIAIHTADIRPTGDDYLGTPVNRVARIVAAANGGQTLVSDATKTLLPATFSLKDLGTHVLRDLQEPTKLWQLGTGEFGPVRSISSIRNNLPLQTTTFIGRQEEIAEISRLLLRSRLVTLTGTGGTGKSRLALQFAADHLELFPDGVWFCELASLSEREDVLRAIVTATGAPDVIGSLHDRLVMYLSGKKSLVILDNCEHVLDAASKVAEDLLASCATTIVLTTSREPLGARGETPFRVPSLSVPEMARRPGLEELDRYGSTALFLDRLSHAAPDYELQAIEAPTIVKICSRLDGIPLAIELAAARGRVMTLEQIEKRLDDRFRLLTGGSRNALSRQQTLRALIDWSVQLLSEKEKDFFVSLAVFSGGWDIEAAEQVCATEDLGLESWEAVDLLSALVDKSLVVFERLNDRYRMLESVRQYALERLEQHPMLLTLRDRHAEHFFAFANSLAPEEGGHQVTPDYKKFSLDYENFRASIDWVAGKEDGLLSAISTLTNSWAGFHSLGNPDEFVRMMEPMLERAAVEFPEQDISTHRLFLNIALVVANDPRGYAEAVAKKNELDALDPTLRARWRIAIGYSLFCAGNFQDCVDFSLESIDRVDARANPEWFAYVFVHLGNAQACLGLYDEALASFRRAEKEHLVRKDLRGVVATLANIVILYMIFDRRMESLQAGLELNSLSTSKTIYIAARGPALLAFGLLAMDREMTALAARFLGGALGMRERSGVAGDPLDRLGEQALHKRVEKAMTPSEFDTCVDAGRRHDWEPWLQKLVALKPSDLGDPPMVPFPELTGQP